MHASLGTTAAAHSESPPAVAEEPPGGLTEVEEAAAQAGYQRHTWQRESSLVAPLSGATQAAAKEGADGA